MSGNGDDRPRERFGVILTFELVTDSGELLSVHRHGAPLVELVRGIVDDVRARYPFALCVSYSTPATVLNDLRGRRLQREGELASTRQYPERSMLTRAGVGFALHPRLGPLEPEQASARVRARRRARVSA